MTTHQVTTGYVSAVLALPEVADTTAARTVGLTLPGGWILQSTGIGQGRVAVEVTVGAADVAADANTVRVQLPPSVAGSDTLMYVTYTALERLRQQQRKVTVHATALYASGGQAVLLLGAKGAGKTSVALALGERGWVHAGDDLVVIGQDDNDGLVVWPGKPTAAIRDPGRPLAPKPQCVLEPFAAGPARLSRIVRLAVHPALATASLTPAQPLSVNERLRLSENMARYISGLPTPLGGITGAPYGPVWPLDTPACARWRSHLITQIADCRFDYVYAPCPQTAADLLIEEAETG
ncbi:phosphoenolpyruvate carboxykinase (ATP) [Sphaerimonospora thailandensis]|uniref:Hpr(Ser) kinase/phosphatase n=1 Tax=Sphaerimonospora thailandensis TaxID=795644 RepID=A0A8J3R298_9ACTN|nr:hypothetical protein [Sphaerimonospora thailandensis]GIH67841.1 hypothetical protein Mth01_00940 [Sphaerimonospora thailandensis]